MENKGKNTLLLLTSFHFRTGKRLAVTFKPSYPEFQAGNQIYNVQFVYIPFYIIFLSFFRDQSV